MLERIHIPGLWRRAIARSSLGRLIAQKKDEDDQDTGSFLFLVQRASTDGLCRVVGWQNWFSQIPTLELHSAHLWWKNIFYTWDKYILQFGNIETAKLVLANSSAWWTELTLTCIEDKYIFLFNRTNTFCCWDQYILQFGQIQIDEQFFANSNVSKAFQLTWSGAVQIWTLHLVTLAQGSADLKALFSRPQDDFCICILIFVMIKDL